MTAHLARDAAGVVPSTDRSIEDLDLEICRLVRQMNAETYRMLLLVRDFDDRFGFAKWGLASCAEWLAWRCGLSLSAAREKVRTAQALRSLSAISAAFADGRLSYSKVRALTRVAVLHDEDLLLAYALEATASQAEERCRQIRNVEPDSVHAARRAWADHCQIIMHVDESALRGGAGRSDLPIDTVKRLACDGSLITVIEDERGTPLDVGRKRRTVTTALKRALWSRDRGCSFPGCHCTRYVDAHHIRHWAEGGDTSLANLTLLCTHHHTLLHEGGFSIHRDSGGGIYFRRPDGRVIPRSGYRADDMCDDIAVALPSANPSAEARVAAIVHGFEIDDELAAAAWARSTADRNPSAEAWATSATKGSPSSEVREAPGKYRVATPQALVAH